MENLEHLLPHSILAILTFLLALGLELFRFLRLRAFHLDLKWGGGHRYTYYLDYLILTACLGPTIAAALTYGLSILWAYCLALPSPLGAYIGGLYLLLLGGCMAGLLFSVLHKVREEIREIVGPLLILTALAVVCFFVEPLRWIWGGSLVGLFTSAVGQKVRFTGWQDLVEWVRGSSEEASSPGSAVQRLAERLYRPRRIRIIVLTETEGYLARSGEGQVEVEENPVAPEERAGRFILDAGRLEALVEAVQKVEERADLLGEILPLIAENVEKIAAYKRGVEQRGEGEHEQQRREVEEFIRREVFEASGFGERMRSLLYSHYDLPGEEVRVSISRVPRVRLVPLLSWAEYFGLFLGKVSTAEPSRKKG